MRWFSFHKIDLLFTHQNQGSNLPTLRDIRGQNILPVMNAIKRGSAFNHHNHENGSTINVFSHFLVQTEISGRKVTDGQCGTYIFLILVLFLPQISNSLLLRTHILGNFVGRHHKDLFLTRNIWTTSVPSFMYIFLVGSFSTPCPPFSIQNGVSMSVWTTGSNYVVKLSESFEALSQYAMPPHFQKKISYLDGKRLASKSSKTASNLTSMKLRNNHELISHLRVQCFNTFFSDLIYQ